MTLPNYRGPVLHGYRFPYRPTPMQVIRAPSLPHPPVAVGWYITFKPDTLTAPADDDLIGVTVSVQGPLGGWTAEWDDDADFVPAPNHFAIPFVGTETTPGQLAPLIIGAMTLAGLPFNFVYDNTTGAQRLNAYLFNTNPPVSDFVVNMGLSGTGTANWATGSGLILGPAWDGTGIIAVPAPRGPAPGLILVATPPLPREPQGPQNRMARSRQRQAASVAR